MTEESDEIIAGFAPLIQKALYCEGIYESNSDYDDYFQGLNLVLLSWLRAHPEAEAEACRGELFNRFRWAARDLRRKNLRLVRLEARLVEEPQEESYTMDEELATKAVLVKLDSKLSDTERRFLKQRLAGQTVADIARCSKVSRPTVYKWKRKVQEKYEGIED